MGVVATPAPNGTFLDGITRQCVIAFLRDDSIKVEETHLTYAHFQNADGIFSSATALGTRQVYAKLSRRHWELAW